MAESQATSKPELNGIQSASNQNATTKRAYPRRERPKPKAYADDKLGKPSLNIPKIAKEGRSFESLDVKGSFALTPDGNEMYFKKDKTTGVKLADKTLWNCAGLTIYEFIW